MNHAVSRAVEDEEGDGVERDDGHHPEHLLVEAAPVPPYHENSQRGRTTPVGGAGEQTGHQRDTDLLPSGQRHVPDPEQYQSPEQRPGNTRGIEKQVIQRVEARHIEVAESEVAHHGQHQQAAQIAAEVVRVMIALGHEEYHHRGRQPADAVQEYLQRRLRLLIGLDTHPCQMVDRHGDDGYHFQGIAA